MRVDLSRWTFEMDDGTVDTMTGHAAITMRASDGSLWLRRSHVLGMHQPNRTW
jgi:hypothetical protein